MITLIFTIITDWFDALMFDDFVTNVVGICATLKAQRQFPISDTVDEHMLGLVLWLINFMFCVSHGIVVDDSASENN